MGTATVRVPKAELEALRKVAEAANEYVTEMGFDHRPVDAAQRQARLDLVTALKELWPSATETASPLAGKEGDQP